MTGPEDYDDDPPPSKWTIGGLLVVVIVIIILAGSMSCRNLEIHVSGNTIQALTP